MKKGILIVVAIILMILAVLPVVDYFITKQLIYGKGHITNTEEYTSIKNNIIQSLDTQGTNTSRFFNYFSTEYHINSDNSIAFMALLALVDNENNVFSFDTVYMLPYISYLVDLFLIWFVLFAILQVPIFTMRLMGLKEDKGGKRL